MRNLTEKDLKALWPKASPELVAGILTTQEKAFELAGITKAIRLAHFMAQLSHESGGGTILAENLNYSARRMTEVWPKRFPTIAAATPFSKNPKALAIRTYGGRMGNREGTEDGWTYRGRGLIQITGRDGYANVGKEAGLDLVNHPDLAYNPEHAFLVAAAFWKWKGSRMNQNADRDDLIGVTKLVNGGTNGLEDRRHWLAKCKRVIGI